MGYFKNLDIENQELRQSQIDNIALAVFQELQNAEEIGGIDSTADYIRLMTKIINECQYRINNALIYFDD